ncbi:MAG: RNA polymerase sigma factor [Sporocytophaga sp.]|uniref:RNA polymerase sigma factor n=1 Tax=Sporocytophaga sp. TaxID=2231183 RepID=UPI001B1BDEA6|nr:RNA polymerase sigma factor [Sporocytophaga sp.]MBO9701832.1 RNA polymerase sigma factor [Sporocytophaga sp.]
MSSIKTLYAECLKGNAKAQRALFKAFSQKMFTHCYRYLRNREDAEDAIIQGFLKVYQNIHKLEYQGEKEFEAWIRKIIVNEALMFLRKKDSIKFYDHSEAEEIHSMNDDFSRLCAEDIYAMIAALPTGLRTIFNLYAIEGYSHQEIATMLDIGESTSRSQLVKARRALQYQLTKNNHSHEA